MDLMQIFQPLSSRIHILQTFLIYLIIFVSFSIDLPKDPLLWPNLNVSFVKLKKFIKKLVFGQKLRVEK